MRINRWRLSLSPAPARRQKSYDQWCIKCQLLLRLDLNEGGLWKVADDCLVAGDCTVRARACVAKVRTIISSHHHGLLLLPLSLQEEENDL